jgi:hypothetical protein
MPERTVMHLSPFPRVQAWLLVLALGATSSACGSDSSTEWSSAGSAGAPGGAAGSPATGGSGGAAGGSGAGGSSGGGSSSGGASAGDCPAAAPAKGAACTGQFECTYFDCAGQGQTTARCNGSTVSLETLPCSPFVCGGAGGPECPSGGVCVDRGAGPMARVCVENPCGVAAVSCSCAGTFCDGAACSVRGPTIHCGP